MHGRAGSRHEISAALHDFREVFGRRAAAATHDRYPELGDEHREMLGEGVRSQVVVHPPVDDRGQAGVGKRREQRARLSREVTKRLVHLDRSRGTVHADDIWFHRLEGAKGRPDLGTEQHPARELDRHLDLDRHLAPHLAHCAPGGLDSGLGLEQVVTRLDQEQVGTPFEQSSGEDLIAVPQVLEADLSEGGEFRAGTHASRHIAGPIWRRVTARDLLRQTGRGAGELFGSLCDLVLGEHQGQRTERVRLDNVDADLEEGAVKLPHDVRTAEAQHLVATLEPFAPEVMGAQFAQLQIGAGGAVIDDYALARRLEVALGVAHWGQSLSGHSRNESGGTLAVAGHVGGQGGEAESGPPAAEVHATSPSRSRHSA